MATCINNNSMLTGPSNNMHRNYLKTQCALTYILSSIQNQFFFSNGGQVKKKIPSNCNSKVFFIYC